MNWKFNPKTGQMEPQKKPAIDNAVSHVQAFTPEWVNVRTLREGLKVCYDGRLYYLAVCFNGKWRILGTIRNMNEIQMAARGPLTVFHDQWLRGIPTDNPKAKEKIN